MGLLTLEACVEGLAVILLGAGWVDIRGRVWEYGCVGGEKDPGVIFRNCRRESRLDSSCACHCLWIAAATALAGQS